MINYSIIYILFRPRYQIGLDQNIMNLEKLTKESKKIRPWLSWLFITLIFVGIAYYANFRSNTIYDPDSFYHIRHTAIYQEQGILYSEFPWVQYSVIKDLKADLWYGFHIFLLPFAYFNDLTLGIKLAGFSITFLVLWSFYVALKNLGVSFPALWSSLFIFSSPMVLFRMAMTRPHPLSLGLFVLIFSFLVSGPVWPIFIFGFLVAWLHSSLFWFPFFIFFSVSMFRIANRRNIDFYKLAALTGGIFTGLFARPNPIANLKLIYIQIVDLYLSKKALDPIIGGELKTPKLMEALINAPLFILIMLVGISLLVIFLRKRIVITENKKIAISSSLALTLASISMYMHANRAIDILAAFAVVFIGLTVSLFISEIKNILPTHKKPLPIAMVIILSLSVLGILNSIKTSRDFLAQSKLRTAFMEPAQWLEKNTKEGDIVFYLNWSQFPILFFWNQHNYYIDGMDPIFLYAYNQNLYWKIFYMFSKDMGGLTCGSPTCGPNQIEPVYDVLVKDFKVSYLFIRKLNNPRFREYIESDKNHFEKVYDEGSSIIYKVLPPKPLKTIGKIVK